MWWREYTESSVHNTIIVHIAILRNAQKKSEAPRFMRKMRGGRKRGSVHGDEAMVRFSASEGAGVRESTLGGSKRSPCCWQCKARAFSRAHAASISAKELWREPDRRRKLPGAKNISFALT